MPAACLPHPRPLRKAHRQNKAGPAFCVSPSGTRKSKMCIRDRLCTGTAPVCSSTTASISASSTAASTTPARQSAARERRRFSLHTCPLKAHATMGMSPSTGMQNSTRHKKYSRTHMPPCTSGCALWGGVSPVFWAARAAACASAGGQMASGTQGGFSGVSSGAEPSHDGAGSGWLCEGAAAPQ